MVVEENLEKKSDSKKEFEKLLANEFKDKTLKENSIVSAKVLEITSKHVLLDLGLKSEAVVDIAEFKNDGSIKDLKVNQTVELFLESSDDSRGNIVVSYEKCKRLKVWKKLVEAYEKKKEVVGEIKSKIRGGFLVIVEGGYPCFLPQSHLSDRTVRNQDSLFNTPLKFLPVRLDKARANCSVSRRAVLEKNKSAEIKEVLKDLKEGMIIKGAECRGTTEYGAFFSYKSLPLLVHIGELSHHRVKSAKSLCKIGDKMDLKIIKIDEATGRVSGSIKALTESPWENIDKRYKPGQDVTGVCSKIEKFGAFFDIEPNLSALCHNSQISWTDTNAKASKIFSVSEKVKLKILSVEKETQRVSVSYRMTKENPWDKIKDEIGQKTKFVVNNISERAIYGETNDTKLPGVLPLKELSYEGEDPVVLKKFKKGQIIDVKIVDLKDQKLKFSVRQLEEDPILWFKNNKKKIGDVITTTVQEIMKNGIKVSVGNDKRLLVTIKKSQLAKESNDARPEIFTPGKDRVDAKIIELDLDPNVRKVGLSIKEAQIDEEKSLVKKFGEKSGAKLRGIFEKALNVKGKKKK